MKKALVSAILGLATLTPSVHGQGVVFLYNYSQPGTAISVNGIPIQTAWGYHVGLYWALSSVQSAVAQNAAMAGDQGQGQIPVLSLSPTTTTFIVGYPGLFGGSGAQPVVLTGAVNQTVTLVVVAYNGANYNSSTVRGHSAAFEMPANASPLTPHDVGEFMQGFNITIPEPTTFALMGLGLAGLLFFHRKHP